MTLLDYAKLYIKLGFEIVPIRSIKIVNGKKVVDVASWKDKKYTLKDFRNTSVKGIAIKTGKGSNLFVLDVDKPLGIKTLKTFGITKSDFKNLPLILTQSGGFHIYFKHPVKLGGEIDLTRAKPKHGIDLRGDNGLVFAPPTNVNGGGKYKFIIKPTKENLNDPPEKFAKTILELFETKIEVVSDGKFWYGIKPNEKNKEFWEKAVDKYSNDKNYIKDFRSEIDFRLACVWYKNFILEEELRNTLLTPHNSKLKEVGEEWFERLKKDARQRVMKDGVGDLFVIVRYLKEMVPFITIQDYIYFYNNGVYIKKGLKLIQRTAEKGFPRITNNQVTEIAGHIMRATLCERDKFDKINRNLINLKNGVFNRKTKELLLHNPKYKFMHQIPVNYDPAAKCPRFDKFLKQLLPNQPNQIKTIFEYIGYILHREITFKKSLLVYGALNTGKTQLYNVFYEFFGIKNAIGTSLKELGSDKFAKVHLYNRHLNCKDDLSNDVFNIGNFKEMTGGGVSLTGQEKHKASFPFYSYCKFAYFANELPPPKNADDAFYFRWITIELTKVFKGGEILLNHYKTFTTPKELSGILNKALEGLDNLFEQKKFSYEPSIEEVKDVWLYDLHPARRFVVDWCVYEEGNWISKQDLYNHYRNWADFKNEDKFTLEMFGRKIKRFCNYIRDGRKGTKPGWYNIKVMQTYTTTLTF